MQAAAGTATRTKKPGFSMVSLELPDAFSGQSACSRWYTCRATP